MKKSVLMFFIAAITAVSAFTQTTERPMIWVKPSDKAIVLDKIANNQWAKDYYVNHLSPIMQSIQNLKSKKAYVKK